MSLDERTMSAILTRATQNKNLKKISLVGNKSFSEFVLEVKQKYSDRKDLNIILS